MEVWRYRGGIQVASGWRKERTKSPRGSELRGKGERASELAEGQLVWREDAQRQEASFQQRGKTGPWFHYRRHFFLFLIPRFRE